jgi:hypothetical protein
MDLTAEEVRVLACLVEKQLTTPQQYPLTLNALVTACNQSSNRDPVVSYEDSTVEAAVRSLKIRGLARFVHPSHGRSALRFEHRLDEALGLDDRQLALLTVLALRGPQTPGELRARTERMASFPDLGELEAELARLAADPEPLVRELPRRPGQKEQRYAHLLSGEISVETLSAIAFSPLASPREHSETRVPISLSLAEEVAALRSELGDLRDQVRELRDTVAQLRELQDLLST